MNAKSRSLKLLPIVAVLALTAAVVILASWPYLKVQAIQDSEDFPSPFGLAQGQTARLTVFNRGEDSGIIIDYKFVSATGLTLAATPEPHLVPPGQFRYFDFDLPNPPPGTGDFFGRIQIRAVVRALGGPDARNLQTSVEVFDNATGKTSVVIQPPSNPD